MELLWTPEAIRDREVIYSYIESDSPSAAIGLDNLVSEKNSNAARSSKNGTIGEGCWYL